MDSRTCGALRFLPQHVLYSRPFRPAQGFIPVRQARPPERRLWQQGGAAGDAAGWPGDLGIGRAAPRVLEGESMTLRHTRLRQLVLLDLAEGKRPYRHSTASQIERAINTLRDDGALLLLAGKWEVTPHGDYLLEIWAEKLEDKA
jgi:hypothetical protein